MSLNERAKDIVERFSQYSDWEDRYKELILIGKKNNDFKEENRAEKFLVKGCQSQVWLVPKYSGGVVTFEGDSDAAIVKGIVTLLVQVCTNSTPQELLDYKMDFLQEIGITEHLSMNRTNGLASMVKQIKMYGFAYKSLADKGINNAP